MKGLKQLFFLIVLVILVSGCSDGGETVDGNKGNVKEIVVNASGGKYNDALRHAFFEEFTEETGISVIDTSPEDFGKLKAMVQSGNVEWDLTEIDENDFLIAIEENLLEKIDYTEIDTTDFIDGTVHDYALGHIYYSTVLGYRSDQDVFDGKVPTSTSDLWNFEDFPGPRSLRDHPVDNLEMALLADGVPKDELYPLDIERAFAKLDELKPHVAVWWETGAQSAQVLVDNDAIMGTAWNGRIDELREEGVPIEVVWEGSVLKLNYFGIPRGTKKKDEVIKLLQTFVKPENQAKSTEIINYSGPNKKSFDFISEEKQKELPSSPENYEKQVILQAEWWKENGPAVLEKWNQWKIN